MEKKTTTRIGVFETNSSSTHSICISTKTTGVLYDTIIPDEEGNVVLTGGEFGWEIEKYNDALTKANYAAIYATENISDRARLITEILEDDALTPNQQMIKEVIMAQTGASNVIFDIEGYIDGDSSGVVRGAFRDKELLKQYIFNQDSYLYTSNDNGGGNWNMNSGELDDDADDESPKDGYVWL